MISRLPALAILLSALLTLLACGQTATPMSAATPTMGLEPAATEVVAPPAAEVPVAEGDGDDQVKDAVQLLFDSRTRALVERDAALFHSLLTRELAGSCGLEGLQSWIDEGEDFLAEAEVRSVFLDVADPGRAFAEITTRERVSGPEEPLSFPWPVALEGGEWRAGFPAGWAAEGCPYKASEWPPEPGAMEHQFPPIPGLEFERVGDVLAAVPGTRVVHGSIRTDNSSTTFDSDGSITSFNSGGTTSSFSTGGTMPAYDNQVNIYAELKSDAAAAELVRLYSDGLKHPSWDILDEGSTGDFGWFSWTVFDGEGLLWHGKLVVAPSYEGWKQVWLSLYSDDSDDSQ